MGDRADIATQFKDRVLTARLSPDGKTIDEVVKSLAPYGDHELRISSRADPRTMKVMCRVECRRCSWGFYSTTDLLIGGKADSDRAIIEAGLYNLIKRFAGEVDPDCKTAYLLGLVNSVNER